MKNASSISNINNNLQCYVKLTLNKIFPNQNENTKNFEILLKVRETHEILSENQGKVKF